MLTSDLSFIVSMLSFAAHLPRAPHPRLVVVHTHTKMSYTCHPPTLKQSRKVITQLFTVVVRDL